MNAFNIQNIFDGNGISISLTGMAIVFAGLIIISLYILLLPIVLESGSGFFSRKRQKENEEKAELELESEETEKAIENEKSTASELTTESKAQEAPLVQSEDNDIASLIGLILHLEQERFLYSNNLLITIQRNGQYPYQWSLAGKMRTMPQRRGHAKI